MEAAEPLDDVPAGWCLLCLLGADQRSAAMGNATMAADPHWDVHCYNTGIFDRLHRQFADGLGGMGL